MSDQELADAIEHAWAISRKTASDEATYAATVEHYKALLKVQLERAGQPGGTDNDR